jgi:hypothetical protein
MAECDFCGDPRINGITLEKYDGKWVRTSGVSQKAKFACRECGKEKIHG